MSYYFDVTQDDIFGFCSKLRMLNAFMNYYERNNEVVYPRLKFNNIDIWKEYFVSEFDYSIYFSSKEFPIQINIIFLLISKNFLAIEKNNSGCLML